MVAVLGDHLHVSQRVQYLRRGEILCLLPLSFDYSVGQERHVADRAMDVYVLFRRYIDGSGAELRAFSVINKSTTSKI